MTVAVGAVLSDKWRVEGLLGEGGMGAVFAAVHVRNGARVAIKVLKREMAQDEATRARFFHEGYAANRVEHPGVVRVLDDGLTPEGLPFLVMERLNGSSLEALAEARGGALPFAEVVPLAEKWLEVMAMAHAKGIVHRDIKPENVFVCDDGSLKVLDFGLARVAALASQRRLTVAGVAMGTPAFMPPEQALARWDEVDARSDVYALGASIVAMLTGRLVHDARTVPELLVMTSTQQVQPVATLAPGLPAAFASVLDRALVFRREDRWEHAGQMLEAWRLATNLVAGRRQLSSIELTTAPHAASSAKRGWTGSPTMKSTPGPRPANQSMTASVVPVSSGPRRALSAKYRALSIGAFVIATAAVVGVLHFRSRDADGVVADEGSHLSAVANEQSARSERPLVAPTAESAPADAPVQPSSALVSASATSAPSAPLSARVREKIPLKPQAPTASTSNKDPLRW